MVGDCATGKPIAEHQENAPLITWDYRNGVLLDYTPRGPPDYTSIPTIVDFRAGTMVKLPAMTFQGTSDDVKFHPSRPWVAFFDISCPADRDGTEHRIVAFNYRTGKKIFESPAKSSDGRWLGAVNGIGEVFAFNDDRIVVLLSQQDGPTTNRIWKLSDDAPQRWLRTYNDGLNIVAHGGRRLLAVGNQHQNLQTRRFKVFDVVTGREIFDRTVRDVSSNYGFRESSTPVLSSDGETVFLPSVNIATTIATGKDAWRTKSLTGSCGDYRGKIAGDLLEFEEQWQGPKWKPFLVKTYAYRDIHTGCVAFRTWYPLREHSNAKYWATPGGAVSELPPRVNWPLLGIAQAALAAPLVGIWGYRRVRKYRARQPTASTN